MHFFPLLREAFRNWRADKVPQLAASTAYYTIFSLAPLLVVIIAMLGFFFREGEARVVVLEQISDLIGPEGARGVATMVDAAQISANSLLAALIGGVMLLVGATGVMMALQDAVNFIWKVRTKKAAHGIVILILKRFFSVGFILGIGFLLLISLVISAAIAAFSAYLQQFQALAIILPVANTFVSLVVIAVLFGLLFKWMPDVRLAWRDVIPGAALTSLLFVIGKSVLGIYLARKDALSAYGIAGSLIIVLLWINYSSQIFFFGVEFTRAYTRHRTGKVVPKDYAELME